MSFVPRHPRAHPRECKCLGHENRGLLNWFPQKINVCVPFFKKKRSPKLRNKNRSWNSFCTVCESHRHVAARDWFTFF